MNKRLFYFDNLKAILILLVILQHVMGAYVNDRSFFPIHNPETSKVIIPFLGSIGAPFVMGLFFFVAAYFSYNSAQRSTKWLFLKQRLFTLSLGFLIIAIIVVPVSFYLGQVGGNSKTFFVFMHEFFSWKNYSVGHAWFLLQLSIFTILLCLFDRFLKLQLKFNLAWYCAITFFILIYSFTMYDFPPGKAFFWNMLEPFHFLTYLLYFYLGWQARRLDLISQLSRHFTRLMTIIALTCVIFNALVIALFKFQYPVYLALQAVISTSFTFAAIGLCKFHLNKPIKLLSFIANYLFPIYIFHLIFVILTDILIIPLNLNLWLKLAISFPLSVSLTCLFCWLLRKLIPLRVF